MRGVQWSNKSVYVQDLFLRGNNIGDGIPAGVIESFRMCCAQSSAILSPKWDLFIELEFDDAPNSFRLMICIL